MIKLNSKGEQAFIITFSLSTKKQKKYSVTMYFKTKNDAKKYAENQLNNTGNEKLHWSYSVKGA